MIELKHVSKLYTNGVEALLDINLHIGKEEFVASDPESVEIDP